MKIIMELLENIKFKIIRTEKQKKGEIGIGYRR
jgi:hypothetical protein